MQITAVPAAPSSAVTLEGNSAPQPTDLFSQAFGQASQALTTTQSPTGNQPASAQKGSPSAQATQSARVASEASSEVVAAAAQPPAETGEALAVQIQPQQTQTLQVPTVPATVAPQPPVVQPLQDAAAPTDQDIVLTQASVEQTVANSAVTDADTSSDEGLEDGSLSDIRQRMALIDNAGQLDSAALIAVPVPVAMAVPVQLAAQSQAPSPPADNAALSLDSDWHNPLQLAATADETLDAEPLAASASLQPVSQTGQTQASLAEPALALDAPDPQQPDSTLSTDSARSFAPMLSSPAGTLASGGQGTATAAQQLYSSVGTPQWQGELGQQVIDMLKRGDQQVDLRLHPADLGPLSISLSVSDGSTQAQFQSAHAAVRSAVEQALPQLREALAAQGISLGQASVSDESSRQAAGEQAQRESRGDAGERVDNREAALPEPAERPVQTLMLRAGGVDLYV